MKLERSLFSSYVVNKTRILAAAQDVKMNKADVFDKAWKMAIRNDFSLFDEIVHPDYESVNQGVKITKEMSKGILSTLSDSIIIGPCTTIFEDNNFAFVNRYTKLINAEIF